MEFLPKDIEAYCLAHSASESDLFQRLSDETYQKEEVPKMLSGPMVGNILQLFVRVLKPKLILDIGTFTGYSALKMAEALQDGGRVKTFDIEERGITAAFIAEAPYGDKIECIIGPALESLENIQESADLIFIDADKPNYMNYYNRSMNLLNSGGIIILDNMLWSGDVLRPADEDSKALAKTNAFIQADDRVANQLLPVRDGLMIAQKL